MSGIAACDCTAGPSAYGLAVFMDGGTLSVGDSKRIGVQLMLSESPKNKKTPAAKDERFSSVVPPLFRSARRAARHSTHGNGCRRPGLLPAHVPAGHPFGRSGGFQTGDSGATSTAASCGYLPALPKQRFRSLKGSGCLLFPFLVFLIYSTRPQAAQSIRRPTCCCSVIMSWCNCSEIMSLWDRRQ